MGGAEGGQVGERGKGGGGGAVEEEEGRWLERMMYGRPCFYCL